MEKQANDVFAATADGLPAVTTSSSSSGSPVDRRRLYRKIDRHVMPLMFLCYLLQFLDKVSLNYSNVMGLQRDLGMGGQDFSWLATSFFIAYVAAEAPQAYLLQRFPVSRVLGVNVAVWGLLLCCSAATRSFRDLLAVRVLLGAAESCIAPSLVLVTSTWYTKRQACPRTGVWFCGVGTGQILGGLISFAAQHGGGGDGGPSSAGGGGGGFAGWRTMFLAIGAFNLLVAAAVLLLLPASVDDAIFLSPEEKDHVHTLLALDQGANGRRSLLRGAAVLEALADPAIWLLALVLTLTAIPAGAIVTFSATLISGFGYSPKEAALLNMPQGAVSVVATLLGTFAVLYKDGAAVPRWLSVVLLMVPTLVGGGLMSFFPGRTGALAGIYLINFTTAPTALVYSLVGANTSGYSKKVAANALMQVGFGIANIIGPQVSTNFLFWGFCITMVPISFFPLTYHQQTLLLLPPPSQTFQSRETPGYISAKITILAADGAAVVAVVLLRLLYGRRNRRNRAAREAQLASVARGETTVASLIEDEDLTDLSNPAFRYVY